MEGYKALDLTDESGFFCGFILASLGFDVIKIEPPGGDRSRNIGPFYHNIPDPEKSLYWFAYNANKRGVTLDITRDDGRNIFLEMVKGTDCIIETFPPGYLEQLGLGYQTLSQLNPNLILTSITPFGQTGPRKNYTGCDLVVQAMSGIAAQTGEPEKMPLRWGGEQSNLLPCICAASGTMIALNIRSITGKGQCVDVSMQESMCWGSTGAWGINHWGFEKRNMKRDGSYTPRGKVRFLETWACKDGYIKWRVWTGSVGRRTGKLVEYMESKGKGGDLTGIDRENMDVLTMNQKDLDHWQEEFASFFKEHTMMELYEQGAKWGFLNCPISTPRDIVENPQLNYRGYFVPLSHPELDTEIKYPGAFVKSTEASCLPRFRAPLIGEHNKEVYSEIGLSTKEIGLLKQHGVI